MSDNKNIDSLPEKDQVDVDIIDIAESPGEVSSGSVKNIKHHTSTSERQIKFERAQKCLENAALVSKRIKEHRKAAAELLGKPFDEDVGDTSSEMATTLSERTGYSVATERSTMSVQDALNIPGISESLANTLKQKELLMERIKQYKEISKRPVKKTTVVTKKESTSTSVTAEVKRQTSDNIDVVKLTSTIKEKENALSVMQVKIRAMETTILDLQEKINEKDQIIEAKNKATTLISDNLSKKEKDSMLLLEDTRQQMIKMQKNFAAMESEWKDERNRLIQEIDEKNDKINSLQEANTILENSRFEISLAHSKLAEELELKNREIFELQEKLEELSKTHIPAPEEHHEDKEHIEEEKGTIEIAEMAALTKKIEIFEQLNFQLRQTNKDLENQLASMNSESKAPATSSSVKKGSPVSNRKGSRAKSKSPWSNLSSENVAEQEKKTPKHDNAKLEIMLQSLNKDILEKEYVISQKDLLISQLETNNTEKDATIGELRSRVESLVKSPVELVDASTDIIDLLDDETANKQVIQSDLSSETMSVPLDAKDLEQQLRLAQEQIVTLNEEIEAANKNMIKVKSHSKLKLKQMQKTIDNFSKVSDSNAEIVKLNEELHQLSQKVAELEEEKGNLQLHLVDYDSGRLTESDVYKKLVEIENLAEARLKSISLLETQKFDLVQELHDLQQKNIELEDKFADLSQLKNEQVCSEIKSVQLEEQIDELIASKKELELVIDNLKLDKEQSLGTIQFLQGEKEELIQKLENYMQENMELTDKLEKLSAEKVSSAESIEIVESLTTQEKLELEEYNKGLDNAKISGGDLHDSYKSDIRPCDENIESLVKQSAELNEKVELFTNERQEVMDRMNSISLENESLHEKILDLNRQCESLRNNISLLTEEKSNLQSLNQELSQQIEDLKHERLEIMKETVEVVKPLSLDENVDNLLGESHDEKSAGDKVNRSKSVKTLTKEILKLKNTIKEREAEIADCQMKILSLEEHQEKQKELLQSSASYEDKIKQLMDENNQLKLKIDKSTELEHDRAQSNAEHIQEEIKKLRQEYSNAINARDNRIHELENLLKEYETQILNYVKTLQQKDKEINESINQITKLNDVSQKLKSTIELLEEEKAKDQNVELIKSLNKQISMYQKTLSDYEDKLKNLDEEKNQLASMKAMFENKSNTLETDLKNMEEGVKEKELLINELKTQHQKYIDELSTVKVQAKEQDEEIHEIKLQLRKESIENEKLRTLLQQRDTEFLELQKKYEIIKQKVETATNDNKDLSEQFSAMETRNKELMEKLKKFAVNIKKKATLYAELESQFNDLQKETESKNQQLEHLNLQVETIPVLQEKLTHAKEQLNLITNEKTQMHEEINVLKHQHLEKIEEVSKLSESLDLLNKELYVIKEENSVLKSQNEYYSNKMAEFEIDQKNNSNFLTKISCLEADINKKQSYIEELSNELKHNEEKLNQIQLGHGAKVQECELYIENLQSDLERYKNRIGRLEETISMMEENRLSLERKADKLDNQLREKRQAYDQYSDQEDELVSRLAYLMDNDRLIEKQFYEIDMENQELQFKLQIANEEYSEMQNTYSDLQDYCKILELKANKVDALESDLTVHQSKVKELEASNKRLTNENHILLEKRKTEMDELECEFNTQIENAIKEKKIISEKYEKLCEREAQLESQLQEYHNNLETLTINIRDLSSENQKLVEESNLKTKESVPDYTDQYINEINNLNSVINSKNEEIIELSNKLQTLQSTSAVKIKSLDNKISDLTNKLQDAYDQIEKQLIQINSEMRNNEELTGTLQQKENQIKQLIDKKKLFFEMCIPKTEGLTISSTIEDISDNQKLVDVSDLQSQIVTDEGADCLDTAPAIKKTTNTLQSTASTQASTSAEGIVEPPMVSKKSYLCYDKEDKPIVEELDPFNSEEGWGVDVTEEHVDITPGIFDLNQKISKLNEDNQQLKTDLEVTNTKLIKALKKLKELKASNDMLTKELNISKQISQSSMLDMAIESEMSSNLEELEKKIQELNVDLTKEKREKEALKKQNEVFKNANDRLMEIKEKMDNEVELWKYNFKQANDKISSFQWGAEAKDNTNVPTASPGQSVKTVESKDEIMKLEKENDELQVIVDNLNSQNKDLSKQLGQMSEELNNLKKELEKPPVACEDCEKHKIQLQNLEISNADLNKNNTSLTKQLDDIRNEHAEALKNLNEIKASNEESQKVSEQIKQDLILEISSLQEKLENEMKCTSGANHTISCLNDELDNVKLKLVTLEDQASGPKENEMDYITLKEKCGSLEDQCITLRNELESKNEMIKTLEAKNDELLKKIMEYEVVIKELEMKLSNLNVENDQLLSTVAELRASVSSAVDQRGYEIAELWKQHLTQREGEFQKIEEELRTQLNASEAKYDQLLDKMQSANHEETDKIIMVEQVSSLQNKIQEKEENLLNLQGKYADLMHQIDFLRSDMEDEKVLHESKMLSQREDYEKIINTLTSRNQKLTEDLENATKTYESEISSANVKNENLSEQIKELHNTFEMKALDLTKQIQEKEREIYQKSHEFTIVMTQRTEEFEYVRSQLLEYEKKLEDLGFEKESELAILRLKMHDTIDNYERNIKKVEEEKNMLAEALNNKIIECTTLNKTITDLKKSLEEYSTTAAESQLVLENQEMDIVALKEEISNLKDVIRSSNSKIEKHVTFASDANTEGEKSENPLNKDLLDAVPRAELDLALYMLHQRDVRCEELTMELTQLLEERDTLQLRLSDSLRSIEEFKTKSSAVLDVSDQDVVSELPSTSFEKEQLIDTQRTQTSRSSSISDPDPEKPKLQAKLSELRTVKHSRDVRLRHESEQRQMGMRLLHRDVANLPPEAVDQLAQAHHTLTRDSQSTPTVLLNWLRGKSTPKVVHM
ncbi:uncharacterized protein [Epargyreus clarus]|uniref:uncharacterized protein n=1 Tax=Epargyreus clarus TaxID=520877 RepID=UPI003C2F5F93